MIQNLNGVLDCRKVEPELFPCLRKYGISFYEFNPRKLLRPPDALALSLKCPFIVGGGFFTGRYHSPDEKVEPGSRFDPEKGQGKVRLT